MYDPKTMKAQRIAGFRSKNEFAWALAFDGIGLEYLYEPKLFELSNDQYYLPDFYFPKSKCFAEIKSKASVAEIDKAQLLSLNSNIDQVVLLEGYPSFRRNFKAFIDGELLNTIFIISKGCVFDNRKYDCEWWKLKEKQLINSQAKKYGSQVSNAKHFAIGEFTEKDLVNTETWKATTNHLNNQGWHDYLKDYYNVHS